MKKLVIFLFGMCLFVQAAKAQHIDTISFTHERPADQLLLIVGIKVPKNENFTVDWGDGNVHVINDNGPSLDGYSLKYRYIVCGTYTVTIMGSPTCPISRFMSPYSTIEKYMPNIISMDIGKWKNLYHLQIPREKVSRINVFDNNVPTSIVPEGGISSRDTRLSLTKIDSIRMITNVAPVHNPYVQPQYLKPQIIATGSTVDLSSEVTIRNSATLFEVFRRDSTWTPPYLYKDMSEFFLEAYVIPTTSIDYTVTNGIFTFHKFGEYRIKMTNPNVLVFGLFSPSEIGEVFQDVLVVPVSSIELPTVIQAQICKGSVYNQNGFNETQAGIHTRIIPNIYGCDSAIATLNLSYYPADSITNIYDTICSGDSVLFGGKYYNQTGIYYDTLQTVFGCDSIITLHLMVNPTSNTSIYDTVCQGDSVLFNGQYYTQTGIYTARLQNVFGCDSIVTLNLTVNRCAIPSSDACLTNITVSEGVLKPKFECDTLNYTVDVPYKISSVIITATASDSNATVSGDVGLQSLQVGLNIFYITVRAEDSITTKTYTIRIIRADGGTEACLFTLTILSEVSENEFREEKFYPSTVSCNILVYSASVEHSISSAVINATATDTNAKVTGTGKKQLEVGVNAFPISVTSEVGNMQRIYKIEINRAGEDVIDPKKDLYVYPNPTDGRLHIVNYEPSMGDIGVYDVLGKSLLQAKVKSEDKNQSGEIVIDILHLANGVYFLKVGDKTIKFVKE